MTLALYEQPIECPECEGTEEVHYGKVRRATCEACKSTGFAEEYHCSTCDDWFDMVKEPPYQSGSTYCCKRCALIESIEIIVLELKDCAQKKQLMDYAEALYRMAGR